MSKTGTLSLEAVRVGHITTLALSDKASLEEQTFFFRSQAYEINKTGHFVVCQKSAQHKFILLHTFSQETINADLICFIEQELASLQLFSSAQEYGAALFAVLASTFPSPRNQLHIWRRFCINTLCLFRSNLSQNEIFTSQTSIHIAPFTAIYRRVLTLLVGETLLDVGSSFGFFPILAAEHDPRLHIIGYDINPDMIKLSTDLATITNTKHTVFSPQDVLAQTFIEQDRFDTVTAIHLIEHLTEEQLSLALTHLLQVTRKRLIIAVPYEEEVQPLYGHYQVFSEEKLQAWGKWCAEQLQDIGQYWTEQVMGGLLIVERKIE